MAGLIKIMVKLQSDRKRKKEIKYMLKIWSNVMEQVR